MLENSSKFPRFIIYMLSAVSILILIGIFLGETFVSIMYFISIILQVVFSMLDRKYGITFTNHKIVYLLFDFINIVTIGSILYYDFSENSMLINGLFIGILAMIFILILIDLFVSNDKYSLNRECQVINFTQICFMISVFACFNQSSFIWFLLFALLILIFNIALKVVVTLKQKSILNSKVDSIKKDDSFKDNEIKVEDLIHNNVCEGDME